VRVLIDTSFALRGASGTATYLEGLISALRELGVDVVEAANASRTAPAGGGAGSLRNWRADAAWARRELPRRARDAGADVLHHPLPAHSPAAGIPQVVTVHDLAFERLPDAFDPRFRAWAHRAHRSAARRASAVVCPTEATARDVQALWGVAAERVVVAPHGPGQPLPDAARPPAPTHFLYVGDDEPRKNLVALRAAHARYRERAANASDGEGGGPLPLVVAGAAGETATPERLAELYAGAAALVHPALHEGFGLTLTEAMRAGVPVLAGRSPGVVETAGDAALYADPRDPEDLARGLERLASDAGLRATLSTRGRQRAERHSWAESARAHLRAYTLGSG
jgi:glycosyltransferase involved in cell wall biosynthesis